MTPESQNIYDDPAFYAGYARLRENPFSANNLMIDPTRDSLLPRLAGKRVLDLGCGAGSFCRKAITEGALSVTGVDISERMLAEARSAPVRPENEPRLTYLRASLEEFDTESESADLVVSILALHYLPDPQPVFERVARIVPSGGEFLFCVEHPIASARQEQGWIKDATGERLYWPVDDYAEEGVRVTEWLVPGVVRYHRTTATYVNAVIEAGLRIERLVEPVPSDSVVAAQPSFRHEKRRPPFLFIKATRP